MMLIGPCILLWLFVSLGLLHVYASIVKDDPSAMPGGGAWAIALTCFAWPLLIVGLVIVGVNEL